jgi:2-succinyl-5-enolpyruvyl-6-hydroxy-3-cyclohexene-1-carboxylate synthase
MSTSDHFAAAELARLCAAKGIRHAVISPGSRSAPLVIAFDAQPGMECLQVIDERSAAFFALGMAQQLHAPVALVCTSGSAVLNYGPAIAEAFYQRIPLLVITADRPEEWVDQGEGQAIRQAGVLALHMKRSVQLPRITNDELARWHCGRLINEAIDATLLPVPGPVHVNVPFAEPLYGTVEKHEQPARPIAQVMTESFILPEHARWLIQQVSASKKMMILAGQGLWSTQLKDQLKRFAALPQCAVLTEATSNLDDHAFITCIDRIIEGVNDGNADAMKPDLLITFGGAVVSKRIKGLLRQWRPAQHWHIDAGQRHYDTYQSLTHDIGVSPEIFFAQLVQGIPEASPMPPAPSTQAPADSAFAKPSAARGALAKEGRVDYANTWRDLDRHTTTLHHAYLKDTPWCDLSAFETIVQRIPEGSDVHLANSTPARYAMLFERNTNMRWFSNRGTSGIDGCVSTAAGAAFASERPTTLLCGDTAFLYDSNAFWNRHLNGRLRVIVIDNGGGNIFRYIHGPDSDPARLHWFEAPHGRDPMALVNSFGIPAYEASDKASLKSALDQLYEPHDGPAVLVVRTDAVLSPKVLRAYFKALQA